MSAKEIARALGGRKSGSGWSARCPAHEDHDPSLSIRDGSDGRVLVHCHAGCDQGSVIAALRSRGLWPGRASRPALRAKRCEPAARQRDQDEIGRSEAALRIWNSEAKRAQGTLVEDYLASRGIHLPVPVSLRSHPGLKHRSGGTWPAMVALVRNGRTGEPQAIHRTFLAHDGKGKAPVDPQKMMLGPCRGGAVRLAEPGEVLMVGEGIETCLAATQETRLPAWAALSIPGLRALDLPPGVRDVIVLADGDDPGEAAARSCALRWASEGRRVRIARPPHGLDFNDLLLERNSRPEAIFA